MKILIVNVVCGTGSTGRICTELADKLKGQGHEVWIAYGRGQAAGQYAACSIRIGNDRDNMIHAIRTRLFDDHGFGSKKATTEFLKWADDYAPDLLWLHNIHGYYINIELLFQWIKRRPQMQVRWTLHDCWTFTGHCAYFTAAKCDHWQQQCKHCPQKNSYPSSLLKDNSFHNFQRKKNMFTGVKNMTIITPSRWLAELVQKSFLREYPVEVHYNNIDTTVFKATQGKFREKYNLKDKKIILGVANVWDGRKGLKDFLQLAKMLDDSHAIVLVGLKDKQIAKMPKWLNQTILDIPDDNEASNREEEIIRTSQGVAFPADVRNIYREITGTSFKADEAPSTRAQLICLSRTGSAKELAEIYSTADWFVNPTYEDNLPTVNLEAIACGTKVITYLTGGSPETLNYKGTDW